MPVSPPDPDRLLADLDDGQRAAAAVTSGPLAIIAGAGSGKTRVISRRAAYAIEIGVVRPERILLVTFTDRAATEMVERMAALGHPAVMARTFHAAALAQLGHFRSLEGRELPEIMPSKARILAPLLRGLRAPYRFTPAKDVADAIERAKVRRIGPEAWLDSGAVSGAQESPLPADVFGRLYRDYERIKGRSGLMDFEDILVGLIDLLESDPAAARVVRERKSWFSVDEYQDTNPLAERLLELWLGDSTDLAVVGDPDQTIYSFTGATPEYLLRFGQRHPGARTVALVDNYRSSPQVLELANRLITRGGRAPLRAVGLAGPLPTVSSFPGEAAELAALVAWVQARIAEGTPAAEIAVLVRINAQLPPVEAALARARIAFTVRGGRFFERPEVVQARRLLSRSRIEVVGAALLAELRRRFREELGMGDEGNGLEGREGREGRERAASLEVLLGIASEMAAVDAGLTVAGFAAELERRAADEAAGAPNGVNLLTCHRAKGLEWEAVWLPGLEEGLLPIRQARDDDAVAEERRLLYVGITRAKRHLALSWAHHRSGPGGKEVARKPSRFLAELAPPRTAAARSSGSGAPSRATSPASRAPGAPADARLLEALQLWRRERAKRDAVPAYIVAHDAVLVLIAESRPRTLAELARIRGMGPVKVEHYGPEILALVARVG